MKATLERRAKKLIKQAWMERNNTNKHNCSLWKIYQKNNEEGG